VRIANVDRAKHFRLLKDVKIFGPAKIQKHIKFCFECYIIDTTKNAFLPFYVVVLVLSLFVINELVHEERVKVVR